MLLKDKWILTAVLIWLALQPTVGQERIRISCQFSNEKLSSAIKQLEKQYHLAFTYDDRLVKDIRIQDIDMENVSLEKALQDILKPHQLDFEIISNRYIILKKLELLQEISILEEPSPPLPSVCGTVFDLDEGVGLGFASISIVGSSKGGYTDENGFFRLSGIFSDQDSLRITYVGYEPLMIPIAGLLNEPCQQYNLSIQKITFDQVLVQDRAIALLRSSQNGNGVSFRPDQMGMLPGWGDNDVLRMVQLMPGVHSTDESASNLNIRGGSSDQNLILWDGIPMYHTGHFFGMFSAFNPYAVSEVDVYRSGFGARFGGRVSGLIDITAKPEELDSLEAGVGLNLINIHSYLKAPLFKGKAALLIAYRRSYTDIIQSQTYQNLFNQIAGKGKIEDHQRTAEEEEIDLQLSPQLHFSDLNIKLTSQLNQNSKGSISFYKGSDQFDYTLGFDDFGFFINSNDRVDLNNWGLSNKWEQKWGQKFSSSANLLFTRFSNDYRTFITFDKEREYQVRYQQTNLMRENSFRLDNNWQLNRKNALNFGYHISGLKVNYNWAFEVIEENESNADQENLNGSIQTFYIDYDFHQKDRFSLDIGIRYNAFSETQEEFWEPRITLDYKPFKKGPHIKAALGRYVQFVSQMVEYNDLGLGEQFWIMANQKYDIPVITSDQLSLGLWLERNGWLFDLEFYVKQIDNLTTLNLRFDEQSENPYTRGTASIGGMDLLVKKKWEHYSNWFSYTLGSVEYQFPQLNNNNPFPASHDQLHTINWTHILNWRKWECSLSWIYGSGRPYTGVRGVEAIKLPDNNEEDFFYKVINANRNQLRLPPYHRMDVSLNYNFYGSRSFAGKVGISVFNLYNRDNIFDKEFYALKPPQSYQQPDLIRYDREMLGFTPNIFLMMEW